MSGVMSKIRRGLRKPPRYILHRLILEARAEAERYWGPRRARQFDLSTLLAANSAATLDELWTRLRGQSYISSVGPIQRADYDRACPGDALRILGLAENAIAHRVDLLGSGLVELGESID